MRAALAVLVDGRALSEYPKELARQTAEQRHALQITAVGGKYLNAHDFPAAVAMTGSAVVDEVVANRLHAHIPNLGVPGDFVITGDGVDSLKTKAFVYDRCHLFLLATLYSNPATGLTEVALLNAFDQGTSAKNSITADFVVQWLGGAPFRLDMDRLAASMASVPLDGALCRGGPGREKAKNPRAGELICQNVGRESGVVCLGSKK